VVVWPATGDGLLGKGGADGPAQQDTSTRGGPGQP
jgi:hypothetical protein